MPVVSDRSCPNGIANRIDLLTDFQFRRIANRDRDQRLGRGFNRKDRQIAAGIGAHEFAAVRLAVKERNLDFFRSLDDVIIGNDVTRFVEDRA